MKKLIILALALAVSGHAQKYDGLALTPPMGWNTWSTFASNIDENLIKETAEAMIKSGMRDAGYNYIVLDDTWSAKERDALGNLQAHPVKFPSGMKALGDWLHARGFKFGIYSCAGRKTCAGYPGGWGHEYQDAMKYAEWGVDYLKYDWCNSGDANPKDAYTRMRDALHAAGRPIVFSICEWGHSKPWEWAKDVGHLWRTTGDIVDCYDCKQRWAFGWKAVLDLQVSQVPPYDGLESSIGKYAGPGHWNDPDLLQVGNPGLNFAESRAHFSLWAILAAPLMASNDVRHMTPEVNALLIDREILAISQDKLGKQGWRFRAEHGREVWVRELTGGDWAVALLNTGDTSAEFAVDFSRDWEFLGGDCSVRDIWDKREAGTTKQVFKKQLDPHDVAVLRLKPLKK